MPTQQFADPYATLGVARGATTGQVRSAYRRLAKEFHPDVRKDPQATERMRQINQAWEILSDPSRRARHDGSAVRTTAARPAHWGPAANAYAYRAPQSATARPAWAPSYRAYEPEPEPSPLRWGLLLLLVPVLVLSAAILGAGLLPFPLFGLLLIFLVSTLAGRDR
jgi:DnaJ-like protein